MSREILKTFLYFVFIYALTIYAWMHFKIIYEVILVKSVMEFFAFMFEQTLHKINYVNGVFSVYMNSNMPFLDAVKKPLTLTWTMGHNLNPIIYNFPMSLAATMALIFGRYNTKRDFLLIFHVMVLVVLLHATILFFESVVIAADNMKSNPMMHVALEQYMLMHIDYKYILFFLVKYGLQFEPFIMLIYVWTLLSVRKQSAYLLNKLPTLIYS
ncbi:MAG: hypothetical protein Q7S59_11535 [Sulfurimonas sp.]|nr:hypothetical protein [Sulfurimonas sp.]